MEKQKTPLSQWCRKDRIEEYCSDGDKLMHGVTRKARHQPGQSLSLLSEIAKYLTEIGTQKRSVGSLSENCLKVNYRIAVEYAYCYFVVK